MHCRENVVILLLLITVQTSFRSLTDASQEQICDSKFDCYTLKVQSPSCESGHLAEDSFKYTLALRIIDCDGADFKESNMQWHMVHSDGHLETLASCRGQLTCSIPRTKLKIGNDYQVKVSIWIGRIQERINLTFSLISKGGNFPSHRRVVPRKGVALNGQFIGYVVKSDADENDPNSHRKQMLYQSLSEKYLQRHKRQLIPSHDGQDLDHEQLLDVSQNEPLRSNHDELPENTLMKTPYYKDLLHDHHGFKNGRLESHEPEHHSEPGGHWNKIDEFFPEHEESNDMENPTVHENHEEINLHHEGEYENLVHEEVNPQHEGEHVVNGEVNPNKEQYPSHAELSPHHEEKHIFQKEISPHEEEHVVHGEISPHEEEHAVREEIGPHEEEHVVHEEFSPVHHKEEQSLHDEISPHHEDVVHEEISPLEEEHVVHEDINPHEEEHTVHEEITPHMEEHVVHEEISPHDEEDHIVHEEISPHHEEGHIVLEEISPHQEEAHIVHGEISPHHEKEHVVHDEISPHEEEHVNEGINPHEEGHVVHEEISPHHEEDHIVHEEISPHHEEAHIIHEEISPHDGEHVVHEEIGPHKEEHVVHEEISPHHEEDHIVHEEINPHQEEAHIVHEEISPHHEEEHAVHEEISAHEENIDHEEISPQEEHIAHEEINPHVEEHIIHEEISPNIKVVHEEISPQFDEEHVINEEINPHEEEHIVHEEISPHHEEEHVVHEEISPHHEDEHAVHEEISPPEQHIAEEEISPQEEHIAHEEINPHEEEHIIHEEISPNIKEHVVHEEISPQFDEEHVINEEINPNEEEHIVHEEISPHHEEEHVHEEISPHHEEEHAVHEEISPHEENFDYEEISPPEQHTAEEEISPQEEHIAHEKINPHVGEHLIHKEVSPHHEEEHVHEDISPHREEAHVYEEISPHYEEEHIAHEEINPHEEEHVVHEEIRPHEEEHIVHEEISPHHEEEHVHEEINPHHEEEHAVHEEISPHMEEHLIHKEVSPHHEEEHAHEEISPHHEEEHVHEEINPYNEEEHVHEEISPHQEEEHIVHEQISPQEGEHEQISPHEGEHEEIGPHYVGDHWIPISEVSHHLGNEFENAVLEVEHEYPHHEIVHELPVHEVEHEYPLHEVEHEYPLHEVEHEFPYHEIEHEVPVHEIIHEYPHHEIEHELPVHEVVHEYPVHEVEHEYPLYEVEHEYPLHEVEHEYPYHEIEHEVPVHEVEHELPVHEVEHEYPLRDVEHEYPLHEVEHEYPLHEVEHEYPAHEVEHEYPLHEFEHEYPLHEVEHKLPVHEVEHEYPLHAVGHEYLAHEVKHEYPLHEIEHELPVHEVEHEYPLHEVEHKHPLHEVKHKLPINDIEHEKAHYISNEGRGKFELKYKVHDKNISSSPGFTQSLHVKVSVPQVPHALNDSSDYIEVLRRDIIQLLSMMNLSDVDIKKLERLTKDKATVIEHSSSESKELVGRTGYALGELLKKFYKVSYNASEAAVEKGLSLIKDHLNRMTAWGPWAKWTACPRSCSGQGYRMRERKCIGSEHCVGRAMMFAPCPANCHDYHKWAEWNPWSHCTKTCGQGVQVRGRECKMIGGLCKGQNSQIQSCNISSCVTTTTPKLPIAPLEWGSWSDCSVTCGVGVKFRQQLCIKHGNKVQCEGSFETEKLHCKMRPCISGVERHQIQILQGADAVLQCGENTNHISAVWIIPNGKKLDRHSIYKRFSVVNGRLLIREIQKDDHGIYHCITTDKFAADVELDVLWCGQELCQHGGKCIMVPGKLIRYVERSKCVCATGYTGMFCETIKPWPVKIVGVVLVCLIAFVIFICVVCTCACQRRRRKKELAAVTKLKEYTKLPTKEQLNTTRDSERGDEHNQSVVSNDNSVTEINESDYKNFKQANSFAMYKAKKKNSQTSVRSNRSNKSKSRSRTPVQEMTIDIQEKQIQPKSAFSNYPENEYFMTGKRDYPSFQGFQDGQQHIYDTVEHAEPVYENYVPHGKASASWSGKKHPSKSSSIRGSDFSVSLGKDQESNKHAKNPPTIESQSREAVHLSESYHKHQKPMKQQSSGLKSFLDRFTPGQSTEHLDSGKDSNANQLRSSESDRKTKYVPWQSHSYPLSQGGYINDPAENHAYDFQETAEFNAYAQSQWEQSGKNDVANVSRRLDFEGAAGVPLDGGYGYDPAQMISGVTGDQHSQDGAEFQQISSPADKKKPKSKEVIMVHRSTIKRSKKMSPKVSPQQGQGSTPQKGTRLTPQVAASPQTDEVPRRRGHNAEKFSQDSTRNAAEQAYGSQIDMTNNQAYSRSLIQVVSEENRANYFTSTPNKDEIYLTSEESYEESEHADGDDSIFSYSRGYAMANISGNKLQSEDIENAFQCVIQQTQPGEIMDVNVNSQHGPGLSPISEEGAVLTPKEVSRKSTELKVPKLILEIDSESSATSSARDEALNSTLVFERSQNSMTETSNCNTESRTSISTS